MTKTSALCLTWFSFFVVNVSSQSTYCDNVLDTACSSGQSVSNSNIYCRNYKSCYQALSIAATIDVECQGKYSCYGITNTLSSNVDITCGSYSSCASSTLTADDDIGCYGYLSCYQSTLTATTRIFCYGHESCYSTTMYPDSGTTIYCEGGESCRSSVISVSTNSENKIYCYSVSSCSSATITGNQYIYGYGSYSLSSSIIDSNGLISSAYMYIYFYGYYSGTSSTVTCQSINTCYIYCIGNGCDNVDITCYGTCIVSCDDSQGITCPNNYDGPTSSPTDTPTDNPTPSPTTAPTNTPSNLPSDSPTKNPTKTENPTKNPSQFSDTPQSTTIVTSNNTLPQSNFTTTKSVEWICENQCDTNDNNVAAISGSECDTSDILKCLIDSLLLYIVGGLLILLLICFIIIIILSKKITKYQKQLQNTKLSNQNIRGIIGRKHIHGTNNNPSLIPISSISPKSISNTQSPVANMRNDGKMVGPILRLPNIVIPSSDYINNNNTTKGFHTNDILPPPSSQSRFTGLPKLRPKSKNYNENQNVNLTAHHIQMVPSTPGEINSSPSDVMDIVNNQRKMSENSNWAEEMYEQIESPQQTKGKTKQNKNINTNFNVNDGEMGEGTRRQLTNGL